MKKVTLRLFTNLSTLVLFSALVFSLMPLTSHAQLSGVKTIPGDYPTLSAAITDLNAQGVGGGGVTFNVSAGYAETITAPLSLTATGTSTDPIVFQKNGVGANPLITAYTTGTGTPATAVQDGIWNLVGSDYVTIDGIDLLDPNTSNPATMEYGYALYKAGATNGCQYVTIKNCTITLNRVNNVSGSSPMVDGSVGIIMMNATPSAATTSITPTSVDGVNRNNQFYSNTIQNCNIGIAMIGFADATPFTFADTNNDVGGNSAATGNTIINYGGGGTSSPAAAIRTLAQYDLNVSYNTINNNTGSGVNHATTLRGIYVNTATSASATINNNIITLSSGATTSSMLAIENNAGSTAAGNTISISDNIIQNCTYSTATSGTFTGISNGGSAAIVNINNNTVTNNTLPGTGTMTLIDGGSSSGNTMTLNNNTVTNNTKTGASGTLYSMRSSTANVTVSGNTINDNGFTATSGSSSASVYGYYNAGSPTIEDYTNNTIFNLTITGASTSTSSLIYGIYSNSVSGSNKMISNNVIHDLSYTNSSTGTATVVGIYNITGSSITIARNNIYNLSSSGGTGVNVSGIFISSGTSVDVQNNLIGNLQAPTASAANALNGINITGGSTINVDHNTVYLNSSSAGTNFGSSALYASTTPTVTLRNNILFNTSTPSGTGMTASYRRSSTTLSTYGSSSNNNVFYAGSPSASRVLFFDGTNSDQTLAAYKTRVSPRDANSFTENVNFASTTGSSSNFLSVNTTIPTVTESGGTPIAGITVDFAGNTRSSLSPDIGAWEFTGVQATPAINSLSITPSGTQCTAVARTVTADITPVNPLTSVTLYYSFNGVAQTPVAMTGGSPTATSVWTGTIPVATPANANVTWYVTASDGTISTTSNGTAYSDAPFLGITATATASPASVCMGSPSTLSVDFVNSATTNIGTGATTSSTYPNPFYSLWSNTHNQYLITAAELSAAGVGAGNITSLGVYITSGTMTMQSFSIKMAHTSATSMSAFVSPAFTTVYSAASYTPVASGSGALNNFTFSTPFNWDGASNIVIEICHGNSGSSATMSSTALVDNTPYVSTIHTHISSANDGSVTCADLTTNLNTYSIRPRFFLTANIVPAISSYAWSDGSSIIGTTASLSVSPVSNTTYSATATDANGCTITSNNVTVTVLSLPPAPVATNSTQCGIAVPSASVSGASGSETYNWYTASSGGSPIQVGGNTYTTAINTTTTFYVAINNGTCDGPRTAVTASVTQPDALTATSDLASVCPNGTIVLTAVKAAGSNSYTYTWTASPATGSGIATTLSGSPVNVSPTAPGTYIYTVTGIDGACTAQDTVSVIVNTPPTIYSTTATPSNICSGTNVDLLSLSPAASNSTLTVGTQTTTSITGGPYRQGACSANKAQYLFTVAELNAAGISAGNITSLAFNVTSNGSGAMTNYTISIDSTSTASVTNAFLPVTSTPVFGPVSYTTTAGLNTHNFTAPFFWNGTSNLVITICHDDLCNSSSTVSMETISNRTVYSNTGSPSNCSVATGSSGTMRPVTTFTFLPLNAAGLNWTWNPGNLSGNAVTVTPVNNTSSAAVTTYTVTATDPATGCSTTATASVNVLPIPTAPSVTNSTHCGDLTPSASVASTTGSVSPVFSWYTVATGGTAIAGQTGTSLVNYPVATTTTFYVAETNGICEGPRATVTVTVNTPPAITLTPSSTTICSDQTVSITASSTNQDYTYTWAPGALIGATQNLMPGTTTTYTVTALDNTTGTFAGCIITETATVTVNPVPVITASSATPSTVCSGTAVALSASSSGVGTASVGTGSATNSSAAPMPFNGTYGGSKGQYLIRASELTAAGLAAGNINSLAIEITVAGSTYNGLTIGMAHTALTDFVTPVDIQGGMSIVYPATNFTPAVGVNTFNFTTPFNWDGTSNVIVSISWSNDNTSNTSSTVKRDATSYYSSQTYRQDNETSANMAAFTGSTGVGTYSFTRALFRPMIVFNANVNSTASNTWTWNPGNQTGNSVAVTPVNNTASPAVETYTVTVTNPVTTCNATATVPVTINPAPTASITSSTNVTCNGGNNGSATVIASGGDGSYTYSWNSSPAQTTATATNLTAGSYTVTVTAGNLCTATASVTITEPQILSATMMSTNVSCNGGNNGDAMVMPTGGTGTYTYLWSDGQTTQTASNLTAGTYSVTVTDVNSCTTTASVTITEPAAPLAATMMSNDVACFGGNTGDAMVMPTGGTGTYTYLWSDGQITQTASNLTAGTYSVTVTDVNSCTTTASVTITEPVAPLAATTASTNETCAPGTDGTASVNVSGGTAGYSYLWNDGQTTATATGLAAGTYTVTITDANLCTLTETVTVNSSPAAIATASNDTTICEGSAVTLIATGGITYSWDNSAGNNDTVTVTPSNTTVYTVTVTDANGCAATEQVVITVDTVPSAAFTYNVNGLDVTFTNGSMNGVSYTWDFGDGSPVDNSANPMHSYPFDGTYVVSLIVSNNCSSDTISQTLQIITTGIAEANGINISVTPNPSEGLFTIFASNTDSRISIEVMDARGRAVYSAERTSTGTTYKEQLDITHLAKGIYNLQVRTGGTIVTKRIVIQ